MVLVCSLWYDEIGITKCRYVTISYPLPFPFKCVVYSWLLLRVSFQSGGGIRYTLSRTASSVSWCWSCFPCSGHAYEIYSGSAPSTYIYCVVYYCVITALNVRSVVMSLHTITLLMTNAKWTMSFLYSLTFFSVFFNYNTTHNLIPDVRTTETVFSLTNHCLTVTVDLYSGTYIHVSKHLWKLWDGNPNIHSMFSQILVRRHTDSIHPYRKQ